MIVPDFVLRARLQTLMARQLVNWREAWHAYQSESAIPTLQFRNGLVIHSGPTDSAAFLFFEIFANGCYREGLPATLAGDVIDVGANIGAVTLDFAMRYPTATVHAYEPDPVICQVLANNVASNGLAARVKVWNEAVAGSAGILRLWRGDEGPAVTIQTAVGRTSGRIGVLKLDCEGSEAEILENAGPSLEAIDHLIAEFHRDLVPDVVPRMERVLEPLFDVRVSEGQRCGPMLRAHRRTAPGGRS